ncbi:MAG: YdeI/OmpD-associated family protein [Patescibacteria group bacterium]|jgi:uncharacterized protein YdeI (YjbR/CyaY-like superfamily)
MKEQPVLSFATVKKWHMWLAKNHASSSGIQLRIFKKDSGQKTISYDEALDEALCFGWIDSQKRAYDEKSWIQKFTHRRAKSIWSKRNKEHVARLVKERRMQPAGLKEVESAKKDGRWDSAYDSPKNIKIPDDFLKEVKKDKRAYAFFQTLNKTNTYSIAWRLQTAKKPETRAKRMSEMLAMMAQGKKFH